MSTPDRYNEELFLGYLEGDLTPEQIAEFEKLLAEDARLRNLVAQLVLDRHRLRKLPDQEAPVEVMDAVDRAMERRMLLGATPKAETVQVGVRRLRTGRWLVYSGIAAMFVLVAGLIARTLLDQQIVNMAGDQQKQNGPVAMHIEDLAKNNANVHPPAPGERETLDATADSSKRQIGDNAGIARPVQTPAAEQDALQSFGTGGQLAGGGRSVGEKTISLDHSDRANSAMRAARQDKNAETSNATPGQPGPAVTGTTSRAVVKAGVKPSAVDGKQPGDRFRDADVPVAPMAQEELDRLGNAGRVQLATSSPESAEADVVTWAQQHNVRIVSFKAESDAERNQSSDAVRVKKAREATEGAGKSDTAAIAEKVVEARAEEANSPRELVLVLAERQVGELVKHLNAQQKHVATHLVTLDQRLALDDTKSKLAAKDHAKAESKETSTAKNATEQAGGAAVSVGNEPAATAAPAPTPAASPAAPASVPMADKSEAIVRLSVLISPAAGPAAAAKPAPATMPAASTEAETSQTPAKP